MLKRITGILLAAIFVVTLSGVGIGDDDAKLDALMEKFFAAESEDDVKSAIKAIIAGGFKAADIEKKLEKGREYSEDAPTGWKVYQNKCTDGRSRNYHLYIPEDYDPQKKYPVFYDLHGGVSGGPFPVQRMMGRRQLWGPIAKENGYILLIPHGDGQAIWWSKLGTDNIIEQLDYVKRNYNVDENKVFMTGFSDGSSGCYWVSFHRPTYFAGLIPLSGSIRVPRNGPYQCYFRNMLNRPIHSTNGGRDGLYPSKGIKPIIKILKNFGIDIDWKDYPNARHRLNDYFGEEKRRVVKFMKKTVRDPNRKRVVLETASLDVNRCDWVRIDEIKDVGNNEKFKDLNLESSSRRVLLGVRHDQQFAGPGVKIVFIQPGSVASKMGIQEGDIITKLDDTEIGNLNDLRGVLGKKTFGDKISAKIKRGGKSKTLKGKFPEFRKKKYFRRTKPSGVVDATVKGNTISVKVKNVAKYTLFVRRGMFNLDEPVIVRTNGGETFNAKVQPDVEFMLSQAAQDNDRTMVYISKIEIKVPGKNAEKEDKDDEEEKPKEKKKKSDDGWR
jgi:predicted esterase